MKVSAVQSCPALCNLPGSSDHGISRQEYWSGLPLLYLADFPDPGSEPRSPAFRKILYSMRYQGNPFNNTGVGSHSLLQGIILTWGSSLNLLHCRWILFVYATRTPKQGHEPWTIRLKFWCSSDCVIQALQI